MEQPEIATLAGGCFWCTEAIFLRLKGVLHVTSGYTGGQSQNPTYDDVCTGTTGHAEAIEITFNPKLISYERILSIFFAMHDPTTKNRQGNDVGTQYRSAIFYHSSKQQQAAQNMIKKLTRDRVYTQPIVTEVVPHTTFYPAEAYHQRYYDTNSFQPYCQVVIDPKIQKLLSDYRADVSA